MSYSRHIFGKHASHTAFLLQRLLLLILAVTSAWTKAPAEATASTGTMTSRLIPVHSSGTEAVLEMTTVSKQKKNARRLALYPEQVTFFFFLILTTNGDTVFLYSFLNVICLQQDKRRRSHQRVERRWNLLPFSLLICYFSVMHFIGCVQKCSSRL